MSVLHGDFETRSTVDLKKCGADVYARHPSTDILCFGYAFDDEPVRLLEFGERWLLPNRVVDHIRSGGTFVAHNCQFELAIWNHVCKRYNWPKLKLEQSECTMVMAYAMAVPASLEKSAAAMGIKHQKDMAGSRIMMQLCQPKDINPKGEVIWWNDAEKYQKLYDYCKQDIEVERELYKRLVKLSPKEKQVWIMDQVINQRGVRVDLQAVKAAIGIVEHDKKRLDILMRKVTGNQVATCTATAQLSDWIKSKGIEVDGVAKADVVELLGSDLPADVREALLLRQEANKSSTAKLVAMLNRSCDDERLRGIFQYHGAGTGRWAGRGIQPQNFPRNKISQLDIEGVFEILGEVR